MKAVVSEASGPALNWMVAKGAGFDVWHNAMLNGRIQHGFWIAGYYPGDMNSWLPLHAFNPSTNWSQGGPIIERERIDVMTVPASKDWVADKLALNGWVHDFGPTPLIAAMRCYVASKLGDEVEVPDGL